MTPVTRELSLLLRFVCERMARSCFLKAKGDTIRILARKMERAVYVVIEHDMKMRDMVEQQRPITLEDVE